MAVIYVFSFYCESGERLMYFILCFPLMFCFLAKNKVENVKVGGKVLEMKTKR